MAPVAITRLRREAIDAGMSHAKARSAERSELLDFLAGDEDGAVEPKAAKAAVKKVSKKQPAAVKKTPVKKAPSNGRRKKAVTKPARKQSTKPAARNGNGDAGRATIGKVDYTVEDDAWKPRKGSPVELIWKSLKKHRDNVDKVFDELKTQLDKFTEPKSRSTGRKKSTADREATLRYRINRTRFEYAVRTGQHEVATNRDKYGTGKYAQESAAAKKAPARKPATTKRTTTRKPAAQKPARKSTTRAAGRKKKVVRR